MQRNYSTRWLLLRWNYCSALLSSCTNKSIKTLQLVQNAAAYYATTYY